MLGEVSDQHVDVSLSAEERGGRSLGGSISDCREVLRKGWQGHWEVLKLKSPVMPSRNGSAFISRNQGM